MWFNSSNVHTSADALRYPAHGKGFTMPFDGGVIDASPTRSILHLSYIDSEGKDRTDSYDFPDTATDAELNAFAAAMGAKTNASLWEVGVTRKFATGVKSKYNADDLTNDSVKDNVVILMKNTANDAFDLFIPANLESATMVADTENPDPALLAGIITAAQAIWAGYSPVLYRMSERRKKNRAIKG